MWWRPKAACGLPLHSGAIRHVVWMKSRMSPQPKEANQDEWGRPSDREFRQNNRRSSDTHHYSRKGKQEGGLCMAFFNSAVGVLQTLVVALGAGLGIWGAINLLEGYGNDNPGANAHVR